MDTMHVVSAVTVLACLNLLNVSFYFLRQIEVDICQVFKLSVALSHLCLDVVPLFE